MQTLNDILAGIRDGTMLHPSVLTGTGPDSLLEERDRPLFENLWLQTHDEIQARWKTYDTAAQLEPTVTAIRESAYKKCYELTQHPELSGAVSDDFGLMAMACAMELEQATIHQWIETYASGSIPH